MFKISDFIARIMRGCGLTIFGMILTFMLVCIAVPHVTPPLTALFMIIPFSLMGAMSLFLGHLAGHSNRVSTELIENRALLHALGSKLDNIDIRVGHLTAIVEHGFKQVEADHQAIGSYHAALRAQLDFTIGEVAAHRADLSCLREALGKARSGRRPGRNGSRPSRRSATDQAIANYPNVIDIEDVRIMKRIDGRLRDLPPDEGED